MCCASPHDGHGATGRRKAATPASPMNASAEKECVSQAAACDTHDEERLLHTRAGSGRFAHGGHIELAELEIFPAYINAVRRRSGSRPAGGPARRVGLGILELARQFYALSNETTELTF